MNPGHRTLALDQHCMKNSTNTKSMKRLIISIIIGLIAVGMLLLVRELKIAMLGQTDEGEVAANELPFASGYIQKLKPQGNVAYHAWHRRGKDVLIFVSGIAEASSVLTFTNGLTNEVYGISTKTSRLKNWARIADLQRGKIVLDYVDDDYVILVREESDTEYELLYSTNSNRFTFWLTQP